MRANTPTLLSLYDFARILEINPLHFAGVDYGNTAAMHPHCTAQAWIQYSWQFGDRTSRESVARAIAMAESRMAEKLGFDVLPTWHVKEERQLTQPFNPDLFNIGGRGLRGFPINVKSSRGYVISGGCRSTVLAPIHPQTVEEGEPPEVVEVNVFWEPDSYWEKGEVWADVPAGTQACDVRIYYPGHGDDPAWEIRPAEVTIVAGIAPAPDVAVITIRKECAVIPSLWDALDPRAADAATDADFLDDFAVYVETIDPSCALTFSWRPLDRCGCGGAGCATCTVEAQTGCLVATNQRLGYLDLTPATWNADTLAFDSASYALHRMPDVAKVSYLAGFTDETLTCPRRQMYEPLAQAIAYFAASLLERPLCACNVDTWRYWREDPGDNAPRGSYYSIHTTPFGSRRGAAWAWEKVFEMSLGVTPANVH